MSFSLVMCYVGVDCAVCVDCCLLLMYSSCCFLCVALSISSRVLFVVCCSLFVMCCLLCADLVFLHSVCCLLLFVSDRCVWFVACCVLMGYVCVVCCVLRCVLLLILFRCLSYVCYSLECCLMCFCM